MPFQKTKFSNPYGERGGGGGVGGWSMPQGENLPIFKLQGLESLPLSYHTRNLLGNINLVLEQDAKLIKKKTLQTVLPLKMQATSQKKRRSLTNLFCVQD